MPRDEAMNFWHQTQWSAALAEEFELAGGDAEHGLPVMTSYEGCPPQMAAQVCFSERHFPNLHAVAAVGDEGLKYLKPETYRGRRRFLVVVSDSFTVFQKSRRTWTDLANDLQAQNTKVFLMGGYEKHAPLLETPCHRIIPALDTPKPWTLKAFKTQTLKIQELKSCFWTLLTYPQTSLREPYALNPLTLSP